MHDPLRPETLEEFTGQDDLTRELSIVLQAAKERGEVPPHVLLSGPPGLGKTTLAQIIANAAGLPMVSTSAPALEKPGDLVATLVSLTEPTVVFVDEVHQLPRVVEETLYSAMEDGRIDLVLSEGSVKARTVSMPLVPFTLVAATTRAGMLGGPFRDRFGYSGKLKPYDTPALTRIVTRSAQLLKFEIDEDGAATVALRSRGTPRIANRLLRRVRDWVTVRGGEGNADTVNVALEAFGVDEYGLDGTDREILQALCTQFNGGPVGVATLAAACGEDAVTVEAAHEPYLMRAGLLARTPRGRVATPAAYDHLNLPRPTHMEEASTPGSRNEATQTEMFTEATPTDEASPDSH